MKKASALKFCKKARLRRFLRQIKKEQKEFEGIIPVRKSSIFFPRNTIMDEYRENPNYRISTIDISSTMKNFTFY